MFFIFSLSLSHIGTMPPLYFALTYNAFFQQKCVIGPAQEERITHKTAFFALLVPVMSGVPLFSGGENTTFAA